MRSAWRAEVLTLAINAIGTRHSGAATVLLQLVRGLLGCGSRPSLVLFLSPAHERRFKLPASDRLTVVDCPAVTDNLLLRFFWLQTRFGQLVRERGADGLISLNNLSARVSVPQVVFVQQSLFSSKEALDSYSRAGLPASSTVVFSVQRLVMPAIMAASVAQSDHVVVQTEIMRKWVVESLRASPENVTVIRPPIPNLSAHRGENARLNIMRQDRGKRFLYVGTDFPYKNLALLEMAARDRRAVESGWSLYSTTEPNSRRPLPSLRYLGMLSGPEISEAYSLADALVMPSLVETVGLPLLEAMALSLPIVAADRPYAREICGEAAVYFEPDSAASLVGALEQVTGCPDVRDRAVAACHTQLARYPLETEAAGTWLELIVSLSAETKRRAVTGLSCGGSVPD